MGALRQDIGYGLRLLVKNPVFSLTAILTLALGIGANTAIFSVVNGILIRSLPFRDPAALVLLENAFIDSRNPHSEWSAWGWRNDLKSFEQVAAYGSFDGGVNLTGAGGEPERIEARDASANFFTTLGVEPVLGRLFSPDEERPENANLAVISYNLWQRRFGGEPDVLGRTLSLNGHSFTIIGVTPMTLQYPAKIDVWIPISFNRQVRVFTSPTPGYQIMARLRPGVTLDEAAAELRLLSEQREFKQPITVSLLGDRLTRSIRPTILLLAGAVGFVLLVACANVANLCLARTAARQREMAVRSALGASRGRLLRQGLTESLLIGVAGGGAGLVLAAWLRDLLILMSPPGIPRLDEIALDYRVLAFNAGLSLLTGLLVGALPAMRASRVDLVSSLKDGSAQTGSGWRTMSLRSALVMLEIALSIVLLVGAGLLVRSFSKVLSVDTGFEREHILTVSLTLPRTEYTERAQIGDFYNRLIERIEAIPGVEAVGTTNKMPLSRENIYSLLFEVVGRPQPKSFNERFAMFLSVSPDYFRAMGIPLKQGRFFSRSDDEKAPRVLIVNELMARHLFPDGNVLGQRIKLAGEEVPREIIGVVGAVRNFSLEEEAIKEMFLPFAQGGNPPTAMAIRTTGNPIDVAEAVRGAVRSLDERIPLYDIKTIGQRISDSVARRRFILTLMGGFALLALLIAAIGIYGVMSYSVAQRTQEIGIRMALGAERRDVIALVMKQGAKLAVAGIGLGIAAALALTRLMANLLFGVEATDPLTFAGVALLLAGATVAACYIPARRATRVDPLLALRHE